MKRQQPVKFDDSITENINNILKIKKQAGLKAKFSPLVEEVMIRFLEYVNSEVNRLKEQELDLDDEELQKEIRKIFEEYRVNRL